MAQGEIAQRIAHRLQQRVGDPGRQRDAERVAIAGGVLRGDVPRLAGDVQVEHAARLDELRRGRGDLGARGPGGQLLGGEIADGEQQVVHRVRTLGAIAGIQTLKLLLDGVHRFGVEQLTQLGAAEELA